MGALTLRKLRHFPDNFAVNTTEVIDRPDGTVAKKSTVDVYAANTAPGDLWIGLKIRTRQKVRLLRIAGGGGRSVDWIGDESSEDARARKEFQRLFPAPTGEKWAAYRVDQRNIPVGRKWDTELRVRPRVVRYPDSQIVTILVCYIPEEGAPLQQEALLIGHSEIPAPRPKRRGARKRRARR